MAKRRADAIRLRLAGMDFDTIADRLGYASRGAASKDVCRAFDAFRAEEESAVETWRELEGQRLDRLQAAAWTSAVKGDLKAIETVLKVIAQRSKLLGLDMPLRTELSGPGGGAVPIGPVSIAELRSAIRIAGDPDPDDGEDTEDSDGDPDDGDDT
ncbi:hypothetical protein ACIPW9_36175 [Streptomyces sp. NPDC090052]|uniref:hypothetical protein n=1 Tax=Streptomyces sp. NPDC090052 TaxID=3365931 RepID=UPI00380569B7